ncbi:MAG: ATP-binding cassette domain-containing protein [Aestuariivirga sp.]
MGLKLEQVAIHLNGKPIIRPFSLAVEPGETVTLMGPSGCGKSSLLAYIAGDLLPPLFGEGLVTLNGAGVAGVRPDRRHIGRLFQDDLLFPHLTVRENLLFGVPRGPEEDRESAVRAALEDAELSGFADRAPHTLSGGQRSRIALFRALLAKPRAMLLDEPFAKLDATLRQSMRDYVFAHLREQMVPSLMVTHDLTDAPPKGRVLTIGPDGEVRHA